MTSLMNKLRNRLAVIAIVGVALTVTGCEDRPRPLRLATIPTIDVKRSSVKDVRDASTLSGVVAAANMIEPPPLAPLPPLPELVNSPSNTPKIAINVGQPGVQVQIDSQSIPGPPILRDRIAEAINSSRTAGVQPAIRLTNIRSDQPHPTKEAALEDALNVARFSLMRQLQSLDAPIAAKPSKVTMKNEYIKGTPREVLPTEEDRKLWIGNGLRGDFRWVEVDLELSEDQVQKLRASDRVTDGFRGAGVIFIVLLAIYGFLRIDEFTKGYLTTWLGLGAIALILVGMFAFMRSGNAIP
jgi:hypothetical protein